VYYGFVIPKNKCVKKRETKRDKRERERERRGKGERNEEWEEENKIESEREREREGKRERERWGRGRRKGRKVIIGHRDSVGMSICKVHISATIWRIYTYIAVALRFFLKCPSLASISSQE
jgi:hypothetical protein